MNTRSDKIQENKNQLVENRLVQMKSSTESTFQFVDNRPEAMAQHKLQNMVNNPFTNQASQLKQIHEASPYSSLEWAWNNFPFKHLCFGSSLNVLQSKNTRFSPARAAFFFNQNIQ